MVRISKKHSDDNVFEEIFEQFVAAVAGADSKGSSKELLTELFGEEEKIMFAKRCAALVLLLEGYSTYQVADLIGVDPATTKRLRKKLEAGEFPYLVMFSKTKKKKDAFWEKLEVFARAGLPPQGKGRLKWLYRHFDEKQIDT